MTDYIAPRGGVDMIAAHGGGVGALNIIHERLARELMSQGRKVILVKNGYHGLLQEDGSGIIDLSKDELPSHYFAKPGCAIGSPKNSPVKKEGYTPKPGEDADRIDDVIAAMMDLGVERAFFTCGNGGVKNNNRVQQRSGIDHVLIGKTPDGNFPFSYSMGFSSTVSHDIREVNSLEVAAESSELIYVIQQMDDGSGQPGLWTAQNTNTNAVLIAPHAYEYDVKDVMEELTKPFLRSRGKFDMPPHAILLLGEKVPTFGGPAPMNRRPDGSEYPANMAEIFADNIQCMTKGLLGRTIQARGMNMKHSSRGYLNGVDIRIGRELADIATVTRTGVVCLQNAHLHFDNFTGDLQVDGGEFRIEPVAKVANACDLGIELEKSHSAVRAKGIYAGTPIKQAAHAAVA
jgi:6-phosphofructokinase